MIDCLEAGQPMYDFRDIWELYMKPGEAGLVEKAARLFEHLPADLKGRLKG